MANWVEVCLAIAVVTSMMWIEYRGRKLSAALRLRTLEDDGRASPIEESLSPQSSSMRSIRPAAARRGTRHPAPRSSRSIRHMTVQSVSVQTVHVGIGPGSNIFSACDSSSSRNTVIPHQRSGHSQRQQSLPTDFQEDISIRGQEQPREHSIHEEQGTATTAQTFSESYLESDLDQLSNVYISPIDRSFEDQKRVTEHTQSSIDTTRISDPETAGNSDTADWTHNEAIVDPMGNLCSRSSNEPDNFAGTGRPLGSSSTPSQAPKSSAVPSNVISSPGRTIGGSGTTGGTGDDAAARARQAAEERYAKANATANKGKLGQQLAEQQKKTRNELLKDGSEAERRARDADQAQEARNYN